MIPIVIPSLEPDDRLLELLEQLYTAHLGPVVLIDDGSGPEYQNFFIISEEKYDCIVLHHAVNLGKGRALKSAFNYCLNQWPDLTGCVTADSDGQHTPECIAKCQAALKDNPNALILGVRDFSAENVPWKSRMGNRITCFVSKFLCGISVTDTQTGLRAIPETFMRKLLAVQGERFEFETRMLLEAKGEFPIVEIPIQTVYDSKKNHTTHFHSVKDSFRIYKIFAGLFVRFILSSVSSCAIDLLLFSVFCGILRDRPFSIPYVATATVMARIISALYNYTINYILVFNSKVVPQKSAARYFILAILQMCCSAILVTAGQYIFTNTREWIIKIPVDMTLFLVSYMIQREYVYK